MNVDKDGIVHQPSRRWYSVRETREIYEAGGHVVLQLVQPTIRQQSLMAAHTRKRIVRGPDNRIVGIEPIPEGDNLQ